MRRSRMSKDAKLGWTVQGDNQYLPFLVKKVDDSKIAVKIIGKGQESCINVNKNEDIDEVFEDVYRGLHHTISPSKVQTDGVVLREAL